MLVRRVSDGIDARLVAGMYVQYRALYGPAPSVESANRFLHERVNANESALFLAVDSRGEPAGFAQLYPLFHQMQRFWMLNDLYVRPELRRNGVARELLKSATEHARMTGAAGLALATDIDNVAAQRLYKSEGYVEESSVIHYNRSFGLEFELRSRADALQTSVLHRFGNVLGRDILAPA
jgi:GNAT superfamily N-acetyltransferase